MLLPMSHFVYLGAGFGVGPPDMEQRLSGFGASAPKDAFGLPYPLTAEPFDCE